MSSFRLASMVALYFCSLVAASAQQISIVGVWQAREGTPSGLVPGVSASDVQTMYLDAQGQYRREIVVEGGNGVQGVGGTIVDSGSYRFTPPETFQYQRQSYVICSIACTPYPPQGANAGTLPFQIIGQSSAQFLGLTWTKIQ